MNEIKYMNQTALIKQIKLCGNQIFQGSSHNSSIDFAISQSDHTQHNQEYQFYSNGIDTKRNNNNYPKQLNIDDRILRPLVLPVSTISYKKKSAKKIKQRNNSKSHNSIHKQLFSDYKNNYNGFINNSTNKKLPEFSTNNTQIWTTENKSITDRTEADKNIVSYNKNYSPTTDRQSTTAMRVRRKIFNVYNEEEKSRIQAEKSKSKYATSNSKYKNMKSRYLDGEPLMKNLSQHIEKNIYGRLKTEAEYLQKQPKLNKKQNQQKWNSFIRKQKQWRERRNNSIMKAKIAEETKISELMNPKKTKITKKSPQKKSVEECLAKLRRQTEKLKQRLKQHTFEPKVTQPVLYEWERRKYQESKSKSKSKEKHRENRGITQMEERKFTIINNPAQKLKFMFD